MKDEGGRMKAEKEKRDSVAAVHPSSFCLHPFWEAEG